MIVRMGFEISTMQGPDQLHPERSSSDPYGIELESLESPRDTGPEPNGQPMEVSTPEAEQVEANEQEGVGKEPQHPQSCSPGLHRPSPEVEQDGEDRAASQQERRSSR